jgi:hypothetical protein
MAVAVIQTFQATMEQYEAVNAKLNAQSDPPAGLIIHTATQLDDGMKAIDIWESEADFQSFRESRLGPAVVEVAGPDAPTPEIEAYELFDVNQP